MNKSLFVWIGFFVLRSNSCIWISEVRVVLKFYSFDHFGTNRQSQRTKKQHRVWCVFECGIPLWNVYVFTVFRSARTHSQSTKHTHSRRYHTIQNTIQFNIVIHTIQRIAWWPLSPNAFERVSLRLCERNQCKKSKHESE